MVYFMDRVPSFVDLFQNENQQSFNQNELQTIVDENGRLICFACAEGLYCSVAAALHQQPQATQYFYNTAVSHPPPPLIFSRNEWDNMTISPSNSDIYKPFNNMNNNTTTQIPLMNNTHNNNNENTSNNNIHDFGNNIEEVFIKNDISDPDEHDQNLIYQQVIPTLDENGIRKRYSRFRTKNHVCDFCNKSFTLKQNVQTHMSLYHMSSQPVQRSLERRFQCTLCNEIFKTAKSAMVHKKKVHGESKERLSSRCEYCSQIFTTAKALQEHMRVYHNNERPYSCNKCNSKFISRSGLQRHIKVVHEDNLYSCTFDGCQHPGFKCSKDLEAHVHEVHSRETTET